MLNLSAEHKKIIEEIEQIPEDKLDEVYRIVHDYRIEHEVSKLAGEVDHIDILIASTAIEHDWVLVTHNRKHFEKIAGLEIEDWAEEI